MSTKILYNLCIVALLLIASVVFTTALTTPYSLSGHIYDSDGTTPIVGATVTFTNQNSSEVIYATSTTNGEYQQDAANFASGYYNADVIQYYAVYDTQTNTTTAAIDTSTGGTSLNIVLSAATVTASATATSIDRASNMFLLLFFLLIGFVFLFYSWIAPDKFNYTDLIAAFISTLIFFVVAFYNLSVLGYAWLSMFVVMLALIQIMFLVVRLIDMFRKITERM